MEEMISRETLALESAKSRKRKQEKDLGNLLLSIILTFIGFWVSLSDISNNLFLLSVKLSTQNFFTKNETC